MSCDCNKSKNLPSCITSLIIGEVADSTVDYWVIFKTPDGRIDKYTGEVVVYTDLISVTDIEVRIGTQYEVWITAQDAQNIDSRTDFTVNGETDTTTCVLITFNNCDDYSTFSSQTVTLA